MVALWRGFAMTEPITITGVAHVADERATVVVVGRADKYRQRAEMAAAFRDRDARVTLSYMGRLGCGWWRGDDFIPPVATEQTNSRF